MSNVTLQEIINAERALSKFIDRTPLQKSDLLSEKYECNLYMKREDLQVVRSFKIRGAYNAIRNLSAEQRKRGVVCASAGNHAQGVAYCCKMLNIKGKVFMPATTPRQKMSQVKFFGGKQIEVVITGDTFDDSFEKAKEYCEQEKMVFIHPFDDIHTVVGQGTVGLEIMDQIHESVDYVFSSIGGGGLVSGMGTYIKALSPTTQIIGVEPEGAPGMKTAFDQGGVVKLDEIDPFVDGAAIKQVGKLNYEMCKKVVDDILVLPEGKVCTTILELYNNHAIVVEPAGALSIGALDFYKEEIKGKNVVCVISGGNNDIDRMQEIKERSMIYEGLKHYFIITFPQRAGALRQFLDEILGPNDDITRFEYVKKNDRGDGPAMVGVELKHRDDYHGLIKRMKEKDYAYVEINDNPELFYFLV
ncbi:threonine ammonia-lyase IlvA [Longirhabdus pacifica]|uniref:threonine ammonia-lyase IlvA n=1 Tax=Longirhabdus pacifica TaxID=2305227 RepID=UPI0010087203|nr:threonine ammonia-lyase IlvA [Longirhabdus pacifica]